MNDNVFDMIGGMMPSAMNSAFGEQPGAPMQLPSAAPGGLGGLGGFMQQHGNNMMQALGTSLMSSPSNNPLQGFGSAFSQLSKAQGSGDQRKALFAMLKRAGFSDMDAQMYSANPQLAQMAMQQRGATTGG